MAAQYQLVLRTGPNPGQTFELRKDDISIGRDITNEIVINDAEVSRKHARLVAQAGGYMLEDAGSTNGTFVNGQRLMGPHLLRTGEMILLGESVSLMFEQTQVESDATMVTPSAIPDIPQVSPQPAVPPRPQPVSSVSPVSGSVPPGPVETYDLPEEKKSRTGLYVGCGCLLILCCVLVLGAYAFDSMNLYCQSPFDSIFGLFYNCPTVP